MSDKYLIVGLGNPGRQYENTRHNVGFWVVEELAKRHNLTSAAKERKAITTSGIINQRRVILAKPQTYMNLSGESVRALVDYYQINLDRIIVIHDDLDTPLGTLRLRKTGGHAGQNGMRNIILHLGTRDFARVRFGIGRPPGRMSAKDYVLQPFHGDDAILAQEVIERAADAIELWLVEGIDLAMTRYNGDVQDNGADPEPPPEEQLKVAERAHELAPGDPKPLEALTRLYKRLGRLDDAVTAHLKLAEVHQRHGRERHMIAEWERAVSINPARTDIHEEIARTYEAREDTKRAAQRWLKLADYYQGQGDILKALNATSEALRINPQHPRALTLRSELERRLTT